MAWVRAHMRGKRIAHGTTRRADSQCSDRRARRQVRIVFPPMDNDAGGGGHFSYMSRKTFASKLPPHPLPIGIDAAAAAATAAAVDVPRSSPMTASSPAADQVAGYAYLAVDVNNYTHFERAITADRLARCEMEHYDPFPMNGTATCAMVPSIWSHMYCDRYTFTATCYAFAVKMAIESKVDVEVLYATMRFIVQRAVRKWTRLTSSNVDSECFPSTSRATVFASDVDVRQECLVSCEQITRRCNLQKYVSVCEALRQFVGNLFHHVMTTTTPTTTACDISLTIATFRNVRAVLMLGQKRAPHPTPTTIRPHQSRFRIVDVDNILSLDDFCATLRELGMGHDAFMAGRYRTQTGDDDDDGSGESTSTMTSCSYLAVQFSSKHNVHASDVEATMRYFRDVRQCLAYSYRLFVTPPLAPHASDCQSTVFVVMHIEDYQSIVDGVMLRAAVSSGFESSIRRPQPYPIYPIVMNRLIFGSHLQQMGALETVCALADFGYSRFSVATIGTSGFLTPSMAHYATEPKTTKHIVSVLCSALEMFSNPEFIRQTFDFIGEMIIAIVQCYEPRYLTQKARDAAYQIFDYEATNRLDGRASLTVPEEVVCKFRSDLRAMSVERHTTYKETGECVYPFPILHCKRGKAQPVGSMVLFIQNLCRIARQNRDDGLYEENLQFARDALIGIVTNRSLIRIKPHEMGSASARKKLFHEDWRMSRCLFAGSRGGIYRKARQQSKTTAPLSVPTITSVETSTHRALMRPSTAWFNREQFGDNTVYQRQSIDWESYDGNVLAFYLCMCERIKYTTTDSEREQLLSSPQYFADVYGGCGFMRMSLYMRTNVEFPFTGDPDADDDGGRTRYMRDCFPLFHGWEMHGPGRPFSGAQSGLVDALLCQPIDNSL